MKHNSIHPGSIVQGPTLPEPIEVLATVPMGDALKVIGRGMQTGLTHDPVLSSEQLSQLIVSGAPRDKLLTFTDNRQDALLQSGHFNDFIHVSLLRCALHAALLRDNELTFDRVAEAVVAASGLSVLSVGRNPELDPASPAAADVMRVFGKDGGFIFNPIHNVQSGTPVENLLAQTEALQSASLFTADERK